MQALVRILLAAMLAFSALPSDAQAPEETYEQTRDWIVKKLNGFAGYTRDDAVVTYKDVSMDDCQLRFTTLTAVGRNYADTDTFTIPLNSLKSAQWGTLNKPDRGYVVFLTTTPISLRHERTWFSVHRKPEKFDTSTTIGSVELGQPGVDFSEIANQMKKEIVHAAEMCKVQKPDPPLQTRVASNRYVD
ncbi:MAG TPA: hypothetical protein VOA64_16080 [Candidatus Dormibacteraeota bacterium]|nr:hypothetical protein [Candidatus Dormibacteraeota bacterium]